MLELHLFTTSSCVLW